MLIMVHHMKVTTHHHTVPVVAQRSLNHVFSGFSDLFYNCWKFRCKVYHIHRKNVCNNTPQIMIHNIRFIIP